MIFDKRKITEKRSNAKRRISLLIAGVIAVTSFAMSGCRGDEQEVNSPEVSESVQKETKKPTREYKFPKASEENDLLKIATSVNDKESKSVYLTFDDGPTTEVTPKVLAVLKEHNVKATFFALGKMIEKNRSIAEQLVDEGHLLANHSYYHEYGDLYASSESFIGEIEKTQALIDELSDGEAFKLIRFPGGGHNAGSYGAVKQQYKQALKEKGYYFADWNCLNGDAEAALRSPEQLVSRTKETALGKNLVVLMHDAATKTTTPEALGEIIQYFKDNGYEFKRLDEVDYYTGGENNDASEGNSPGKSEMIL